jgi:hypothetical protein
MKTNVANDTLKCTENGAQLDDQTWYRVEPTANFVVEDFDLDVCTLWGDANNLPAGDQRVTTSDYSVVKDHLGEYTDARYDLNGSGRVTTADYSVTKDNLGHRIPDKP